jgi:hypothetical protein
MQEPKQQEPNDSDWEVTTNRYVGFIDIMGFKDLVTRSTHEEIYEMMQQIERAKKLNETINWGNNRKHKIKSTFYSDSIILYSKDDSNDSCYSMLSTLSALTFDLIKFGVPHKGSVAFGKMTLDYEKSIFFGQPLIDSYLLQEELVMYGVVAHASAEAEIKTRKHSHPYFFDYPCPFKGGSTRHFTIPPVFTSKYNGDYIEYQKELLRGLRELRYRTSGHLRRYIDNTEAFLKAYNPELKFEEE